MKTNIRMYRCLLTSNNTTNGETERGKDQNFMRRGYQENLDFFRNLNVKGGEELTLQKYVDNEWLNLNKKTMGKGIIEVNA